MRKISEMTGTEEKVWVYIDSRETWEIFTRMALEEGFGFGELPAGKWEFGYAVAVHSSGDMGHLPLFVWCSSFAPSADGIPERVDFRRYISGEDDYVCKESGFTFHLQ